MNGLQKTAIAVALAAAGCGHYAALELGASIPAGAEQQDIDPSFAVGGSYEGVNDKGVGFKASVLYHESEAQDGPATITTPTVALRGGVSKEFGQGNVRGVVRGNMLLLFENPHIQIGPPFDVDDYPGLETTFGLGAEAGVRIGTHFELTGRLEALLGSENVKSLAGVSAAYRF